jgi:predicted Zn-dependent protease
MDRAICIEDLIIQIPPQRTQESIVQQITHWAEYHNFVLINSTIGAGDVIVITLRSRNGTQQGFNS